MTIRLSLLLTATLALAACGPHDPGETRVAIIGEDGATEMLAGATSQGLVAFDARGQIQPALAESWHVSDDGRSYIFRLARGDWLDGSPITAEEVAADLRHHLAEKPLGDALGGIEDVVAMTDRVIEIRLVAPRPHLLPLLAHPLLAMHKAETGSGPYMMVTDTDEDGDEAEDGRLHLEREIIDRFGDHRGSERVHVDLLSPGDAIAAYVAGDAELVLGGDFASLPLVREAAVPRGAVRFDPVMGLFGLQPLSRRAPLDDPEFRQLLAKAIDRDAIIDTFGVPSLAPRATILQDGLDLPRPPVQPAYLSDPAQAHTEALSDAAAFLGDRDEPLILGLWVPEGPGGDFLFDLISDDWGALGIEVTRADRDAADFALIDLVAPSESAAWFLRQFSCARARVCDKEIDTLVDAARSALFIEQRRAILADAGARMDQAALFIPLAAPIRWSLVGQRVTGFSENRFAIHPLTGLKRPLPAETSR